MQIEVTIQINGADVAVGTLFTQARRGIQSASFKYDEQYLDSRCSFPIAPDMPLTQGTLHANGMFAAFSDAMPDRWTRTSPSCGGGSRSRALSATPTTTCATTVSSGTVPAGGCLPRSM